MRVLILAYDFPPLISVGSQRPNSWAKYLPGSGISVTVITRSWSINTTSRTDFVQKSPGTTQEERNEQGSAIIRAAFNPNFRDRLLIRFGLKRFTFVRKILSYFYSFAEHLSFLFDSKASIFTEAEKEILKTRPDVIIVSGEPFILFKYGNLLSSKFNIPWIADYRDNWTGNQGNYQSGPLKNLLSWFYRNREKKYISNALLITTAAPTYAASLKQIHPDKKVEVIYNGYDDVYFKDLDTIQPPADKFIITYGGSVYPHQNLEMFLDGLQQFIGQNKIGQKLLEVHFYGIDILADSRERLLNYKKELNGYLKLEGRVPYAELVKKMRASHLLLLLSRKGADWLNAKVFDYLAVKRPVFLVENDEGIMSALLKETNGGVSLNSAEDVSAFLKKEYDNFKKGAIKDQAVNEALLKYSRKNQALVLGDLLNKKVGSK